MIGYAFVTGADRGLGLALCAGLLARGWGVFAGQYLPDWPELTALRAQHPDRLALVPLDVASSESVQSASHAVAARAPQLRLLINNAGVISPSMHFGIHQAQDYGEMQRLYDVNALGPLRVVEAFLPLLAPSPLKRLCFVSSEAGSIVSCTRLAWYGYCMSKAALNMAVKILFNHLRPQGYTFRLYHPGWMRTYMSGAKNSAADLEPEEAAIPALEYFLTDLPPADEERLVLRDNLGREWGW
jgi:NAD(P)-dependent dehydrogenase (short-subunit alcohol dehydrogenase family)